MNILVLNGSPRPKGNNKKTIDAFAAGAESAGHSVKVFNVAKMNIKGCLACEYCHTRGNGSCIQKDDMQEIYPILTDADMLVLASPIYYHGFSGQLKCAIDRFYSAAYPIGPKKLKKIAVFLCSGASNQYDGALYSYENDFLGYLGLKNMGVFTISGGVTERKLNEIIEFGKSLK